MKSCQLTNVFLDVLVPRSFFDEEQLTAPAPAPAVVLPVPIVVPESQHVDMEVSVDDKTSVEDVD